MKYKGKEIEKPTLEMVEEFLRKNKHYHVCAKDLFDKYEKRGWLTKKGRPAKTLESIIVAENGVQIEKMRKEGKEQKAQKKTSKKKSKPTKESSYSKLLQDPRWQKRRLEIYTRDNWTCQMCGNGLYDGVPLNVHHHVYHIGYLPWEYKDNELITLCEKCHSKLHNK